MADPISFDPYLGWVDITDPDNIPQDARVIGAADLLRYENFAVAAKNRINELGDVSAVQQIAPDGTQTPATFAVRLDANGDVDALVLNGVDL